MWRREYIISWAGPLGCCTHMLFTLGEHPWFKNLHSPSDLPFISIKSAPSQQGQLFTCNITWFTRYFSTSVECLTVPGLTPHGTSSTHFCSQHSLLLCKFKAKCFQIGTVDMTQHLWQNQAAQRAGAHRMALPVRRALMTTMSLRTGMPPRPRCRNTCWVAASQSSMSALCVQSASSLRCHSLTESNNIQVHCKRHGTRFYLGKTSE